MHNTRGIMAVLVLVLAVLLVVPALAADESAPRTGPGYGPMPPPPGRPGYAPRGILCPRMHFSPPALPRMEQIMKDLGLTEDQKTKGLALFKALAERSKAISADNQAVKALAAEMKAAPTDQAKAMRLATEAMKVEEQILHAEIQTYIEFEKLLTPEQQTRFWELMFPRPADGPAPMPPSPGPNPPPPGGPTPPPADK